MIVRLSWFGDVVGSVQLAIVRYLPAAYLRLVEMRWLHQRQFPLVGIDSIATMASKRALDVW